MNYDYLFRVIIIGEPAVGKSSFLAALTSRNVTDTYQPTVGVDFGSTLTPISNGKLIKSQIWDTAGQEYFAPIIKTFYRDVTAAIIMFDLTEKETFERVDFWLQELKKVHYDGIPIALIGNKIDSSSALISTDIAEKYAQQNGMMYFEISALENRNITLSYAEFIEEIYNSFGENIPSNLYPRIPQSKKNDSMDPTSCCFIS